MRNATRILRTAIPAAVLAAALIGLARGIDMGTLSAWGLGDIAILCPLGAIGTMIAGKTLIPRAVVSLAIALALVLLLGRAFCGWVCPVPLVSRLRHAFSPKGEAKASRLPDAGQQGADGGARPLTDEERALLKAGCAGAPSGEGGCTACGSLRGEGADTRHWVLGGALVSTLIFGFPVFCLICPIGLTFALIMLLVNLFGAGDVTWSLVIAPVLLLAEVVFFRKWCHKICPLGALMSLAGKLNRTFVPKVDEGKCLEAARGATCGKCFEACPEGIDIRDIQNGEAALNECTKCRACVEACPAHVVSMPFLASVSPSAEKRP